MKTLSILHSIIMLHSFISERQGERPFSIVYPIGLPPSSFVPNLLILRRAFCWVRAEKFYLHFGKPDPPTEHSVTFNSGLFWTCSLNDRSLQVSSVWVLWIWSLLQSGFQKEYHLEDMYPFIDSPKRSNDSCPYVGRRSISENGFVAVECLFIPLAIWQKWHTS